MKLEPLASMRKSNVQGISEVLEEIKKKYRLNNKIDEAQVRLCWDQMMGPAIAKYTREIYLKQGTLYVGLTSAVLRQELQLGTQQIIRNLNETLGQELVKALRWV